MIPLSERENDKLLLWSEAIQDLEHRSPGFSENYRMVFQLLPNPHHSLPQLETLPYLWEDLSIFKRDGLFRRLHKIHTVFGLATFHKILATPLTIVPPWQISIRHLVSLPTVDWDNIVNNLAKLYHHERNIMWFWESRSTEETKLLNMVFFSHPKLSPLNRNKIAVLWYYMYQTIILPGYTGLSPIVCTILPYIILRWKLGFKLPPGLYWKILRQIIPNAFGVFTGGPIQKGPIMIYLFSILSTILYVHATYSAINQSIRLRSIATMLSERISSLYTYLVTVNNIVEWFPNLGVTLPNTQTFNYLVDAQGASALWAYQKFQQDREEFIPILQVVGLVDSLVSISQTIRCFRSTGYPICFAEYSKTTSPYLSITHFWHPLLYPKKMVCNSVLFGGNNRRNMILTGPNASGKSTIIKSITINILLAQTFGISASHSYSASIFQNIYSQIRVPDLEGKESLFQAELNRCKQLMSMTHRGTFLAIFDELFTSTTSEEGISCAYAVCKVVGGCPNGMVFMTTHYPKLTELASKTTSFWNGSLGVEFHNRLPQFDYKLRAGPSFHRIALDLLELEGDHGNDSTSDMFKRIIFQAKLILRDIVHN